MAASNVVARPPRRWRWLRRFCLAIVALVLAAIAWDVASYDARPWLADYQRLKHDMAQGYANLDWIATHRRLDLAALDRDTTAALNRAHSRVRAFLALRGFVKRFGDPHLRLEPAQRPASQPLASTTDRMTEPADPAAGADCKAAGYEEDEHAFILPFATLPDWHALPGKHFPAGRFGDVGVLRIAQFGEQRYLAACRQVFRAGVGQRALQLKVRAYLQLELARTLAALHAGGARRLLVDVTGNGGGSEWVSEVIALLAPGELERAAPRMSAPTCDRGRVWYGETGCPVLAPDGERERISGRGAWPGRIFVLTDHGTASASEDLVAWLQQNQAATVLGERTLGAGCGYVDGGGRTTLSVAPFDVVMPNCARFLADGTNEIEGIAPDVAIALHDEDGMQRLVTALAQPALRAALVTPPPPPAPATAVPPRSRPAP
ncbi:S41 family peptidase [Pseudoxanthomonas sp. z9]|uniref:S41 family peptidase n=1 Tax=Pseudoxanthomonas sp. z9 TaxID=2584942 RepID=UPI001142CD34|nr:S41 family peptidase [Pseudoxanthomonas sp. z9]